MKSRQSGLVAAIASLSLAALPDAATADAYRDQADVMIDISASTIQTAGLTSRIWRLEETEKCKMQLIYGEAGGIGIEGYREKWRIDIPLGSIDPNRIESQSSLGITVRTRDAAQAFRRKSVAAPGVVEATNSISLPVRYYASADDLTRAVRALAEICK